jgi:hypothetical protein
LPWPQEAATDWHHDAARQEESIPSLAAVDGWCDPEPPRLKRYPLGRQRNQAIKCRRRRG